MVDIDLVPLAALPAIFNANGQAIRAEYANLGDEAYFQGRAAILQKFLSRPRIYCTETFRQKYEQQARSNLQRTLAATA
jgi:predicted metal-dependent HD superfamily phosphohydrolase